MKLWPPGAGRIYRDSAVKKVQSAPGPRVIAVSSGKGGVGKTSLSVNLALCLAQKGLLVTLLDADLGLSNAEVMLGLVPPYSLYDVLYGDKDLEEVAVRGPWGLYVISGGSGLLEMANLDHARRRLLLEMLNRFSTRNDFIIVDTGAGINKNVLGFVAAAGEVIVVVTPEPTSLTDAYALIKVLANFKVHREVNVVVNRAADGREAMRTFARLQNAACRFLDIKLHSLGWIPEDRSVSRAVKSQQPFCQATPNTPASRSVAGIAGALAGEPRPASSAGFWGKLMALFR